MPADVLAVLGHKQAPVFKTDSHPVAPGSQIIPGASEIVIDYIKENLLGKPGIIIALTTEAYCDYNIKQVFHGFSDTKPLNNWVDF